MSSKLRVGLNGFGVVGKRLFQSFISDSSIQLVAINEPKLSLDQLIFDMKKTLISYEDLHGEVWKKEGKLYLKNQEVYFFNILDNYSIPWELVGVDYVIDSEFLESLIPKNQ